MYRFLFFFIVVLEIVVNETQAATNGGWQRRASVKWKGTALGESLSRFADTQKIGLLIDRRVDPSMPLRFEAADQSLEQILRQLAKPLGLGCVLLDSTVYLGPEDTAEILSALLADKQKRFENLSPRSATIFRRKTTLTIPFLSEPKEILQSLAAKNSFRWKNLEMLPHDLWDEKTLVNLPLDELLTILLAGFELTFEIENGGETLFLVPLPKRMETVSAPAENTDSAPVTPKIPLAQRRFTLKVEEQQLDTLLQTLAKRLDRTLELDSDSLAQKNISPDSRVSFDVKNATAAQLFQAILRPLKLEFRIKDDSIRVW